MHVTAIIAAGGRGQRFGGAQPKQLLAVGGRSILERSVAAFLSHPAIDAVVVALPQALVDNPPAYLRSVAGLASGGSGKPLRIVAGGERRQDSVANAFRAADAQSDLIVIHDAARPFASADLITRTIAAAVETGAALAALQARDTVKRASPAHGPAEVGRQPLPAGSGSSRAVTSGFSRTVAETLPRETIFLAQTPQAFRRNVLSDALELADDATDEAALAERAGHPVRLVDGEATNIKITTPDDLPIAEAIAVVADRSPGKLALQNFEGSGLENDDVRLAMRGSSDVVLPDEQEREPFRRAIRTGRAGTGYDLHRLVEGRPLILGGVTIPSDRGALGHSDADVVCHALTDAILGAACLGDIGRHFPDSDPRWKDASSLDLLWRAVALVAEQGLQVGNVDVTVILERPKITAHVDAMRAAVAQAIGIGVGCVSIKGKTNEGVDAVGRGEAIAAHAIALVRSAPTAANPPSQIPNP
jgi:2-C-methyl-D-erythritol 2,4-cyclodiphosphate synthase/2-C-methyl-D-erythritol 4-phosphate cytidylyltransferase